MRQDHVLKTLRGGLSPIGGRVSMPENVGSAIHEQDYSNKEFTRFIHHVGQGQELLPHLTVRENSALLPRVEQGLEPEAIAGRMDPLIRLLSLEKVMDCFPRTLSGGEYQRALLLRSLALRPKILLIDEVSSAVDPPTAAKIMTEIKELLNGELLIVMFVTHYLDMVRKIADNVLFLGETPRARLFETREFFGSRVPEILEFRLAV